MPLNYRKIGELITKVSEKNKDGLYDEVLGVAIEKEFMPSVANTIGTDLKKYNVVRKNRFAFNPMHVGRDEKLPIAVYHYDEPALVSPAYMMFEIKDKSVDVEYLMLIFKTASFDHLCWFHTDASVRGGLTWEDFADIEVNIPSLEEQQKIVRQYKTITDRIEVLEKINEKLDELLSLMFYEQNKVKSILLKQLTTKEKGVKTGKGADDFSINETETNKFPVIGASGIMGYTSKFLYDKRIISTGRVGTIGKVMLWDGPNWFTDNSLVIESDYIATVYCLLKQYNFGEILGGSSNPKITQTDLNNVVFDIPSDDDMKLFENKGKNIIDLMILIHSEIKVFEQLKERLISNL